MFCCYFFVLPEFNERMQAVPIEGFADHVNGLHMNRDLGFEEEYEVCNIIITCIMCNFVYCYASPLSPCSSLLRELYCTV